MVFLSFSEKARANFDPSLKMLQIHASSKKSEHIGDTASGNNIWYNQFVLFLNLKTFFPPTLLFYLRPQSPGLLQRLPSLPGRRRTVVQTRRLPCVTPWQSRICPLVTRETSVRHSHSCVAWRLETCLSCSVAALLITTEAVRSEHYHSLFVWKNTNLFVSIVRLFRVDTLVTGHSAPRLGK